MSLAEIFTHHSKNSFLQRRFLIEGDSKQKNVIMWEPPSHQATKMTARQGRETLLETDKVLVSQEQGRHVLCTVETFKHYYHKFQNSTNSRKKGLVYNF